MGTSINAIHRLYLEAIVIIVAIEIIFINKPIILLGQISNEDNPRLLTRLYNSYVSEFSSKSALIAITFL